MVSNLLVVLCGTEEAAPVINTGTLYTCFVADDRKAFLLRLPPALWKELEKWAAADLRSVNGQIEFLLREAVARRKSEAPERKS
jgi:hypothetical protein